MYHVSCFASVLWSVCFCGLPMPPIGLIVHNSLGPFMGDGREGGRERQMRDREEEGREGRNDGE